MRVITGSLRGRKLKALEGEGTRPTTDKTKETIFSIIQFDIPYTRVLDLYAGSGQLGIEALSRGANSAVFVEKARDAVGIIKENVKACNLGDQSKIINTDAINYLKMAASGHEKFDIILMDPPYEEGLMEKSLELCEAVMSEKCIVVCEHEARLVLPEKFAGLKLRKRYSCGKKTALSVFIKDNEEEGEADE
ncbi:MAG: 16S rRNA (guanine(966)-N(2))-methyltransferase RsmD [Oscillospiraceae bacterium]|nr:16S rRNA (guanine(966)-N(2))-methyltransferase RsmD [Oscillospiraceae bacterium]